MAKDFPTDSNTWMILADAVRLEVGGKASILGFFGGTTVVLPADAALPSGVQMVILFMLNDGVGTFKGTVSVKAPDGTSIFSQVLPDVVKPNVTDAHGIVVQLQPIVFPAFGNYQVMLRLDDRDYIRRLIVKKV